MTNIFTICYDLAKNSLGKTSGFFSPGASDVHNTSAQAENSVRTPNDIRDTKGTAKWYNLTIKSIFENILSFFQVDNNKSKVSETQGKNFTSPETSEINSNESLANASKEIDQEKVQKYIKELEQAIANKSSNFTKVLDDLESIPNATLAKGLPEECINHFISTGLPADKAKLVTTELFRSLIATTGSSVRSVLYTLQKADIFFLQKPDQWFLTATYEQALLKTNMPYRTFDSNDYSYQIPADEAKTILNRDNYCSQIITGDEFRKWLTGNPLTSDEAQNITYTLIGYNPDINK